MLLLNKLLCVFVGLKNLNNALSSDKKSRVRQFGKLHLTHIHQHSFGPMRSIVERPPPPIQFAEPTVKTNRAFALCLYHALPVQRRDARRAPLAHTCLQPSDLCVFFIAAAKTYAFMYITARCWFTAPCFFFELGFLSRTRPVIF